MLKEGSLVSRIHPLNDFFFSFMKLRQEGKNNISYSSPSFPLLLHFVGEDIRRRNSALQQKERKRKIMTHRKLKMKIPVYPARKKRQKTKEYVMYIIHRRNPSNGIYQELDEGGKIINNEESHIQ